MPPTSREHDQRDTTLVEQGMSDSLGTVFNHEEPNEEHKESLTRKDLADLVMLYLLYFSQGIPAGLAGATIPTILKRFLPYGNVGIFTLTVYPSCFKLIWGPAVDFFWSERIGRRMTWALPTQLFSGLAMVAIGVWTTFYFQTIEQSEKHNNQVLYVLAWVFISTLSAIQSCVTDGWGVRILPRKKVHWVSSAHTLGSISGSFVSYSLFMLIYESRISDFDQAPLALGQFISYWGVFFLASGALLPLLKQEAVDSADIRCQISTAYRTILRIGRIRAVQTTILVHLLGRLAFEVNDSATDLKLLDKGFGNSNLALLVLMIMPFDLLSAHCAGILSKRYAPLHVWSVTYTIRLVAAVLAALVVALGPDSSPSLFYFLLVFLQRLLSVTTATVMFTTFLNFHLQVADPGSASTYMTILATAQNMGGILPRIPIMKLIDFASKSTCQYPATHLRQGTTPTTQTLCDTLERKTTCIQGGGRCHIVFDGYYVIGAVCLALGTAVFLLYLRPTVARLQKLAISEWELRNAP